MRDARRGSHAPESGCSLPCLPRTSRRIPRPRRRGAFERLPCFGAFCGQDKKAAPPTEPPKEPQPAEAPSEMSPTLQEREPLFEGGTPPPTVLSVCPALLPRGPSVSFWCSGDLAPV